MTKKIILILFGVFVLMIALLSIKFIMEKEEDTWLCVNDQWVKHGNPAQNQPTFGCGQESHIISNFEDCLVAGFSIIKSDPRQCKDASGNLFVEEIAETNGKEDSIMIFTPLINEEITSPLLISGQARGTWFFEASFPVKLLNNTGDEIANGFAQAQTDWMTEDFVPFEANLIFTPLAESGELVFLKDNPSGLPENDDELRVPIKFAKNIISVDVFFQDGKTGEAPDYDCTKVVATSRDIPYTLTTAKASIEELLKGPNNEEKNSGFFTSINDNVKLQNISITDNIAYVDFDKQLQYQVGGSCRTAAIISQIRHTLLQFPSIKDVVISIDGHIEDILQP